MRPTGLGAGIDKDRQDFTIYCGGWAVGRIYETRGGPDHLRWFWSRSRRHLDVAPETQRPPARRAQTAPRVSSLWGVFLSAIKAGKLQPLAVTTAARSELLPNIKWFDARESGALLLL